MSNSLIEYRKVGRYSKRPKTKRKRKRKKIDENVYLTKLKLARKKLDMPARSGGSLERIVKCLV